MITVVLCPDCGGSMKQAETTDMCLWCPYIGPTVTDVNPLFIRFFIYGEDSIHIVMNSITVPAFVMLVMVAIYVGLSL